VYSDARNSSSANDRVQGGKFSIAMLRSRLVDLFYLAAANLIPELQKALARSIAQFIMMAAGWHYGVIEVSE
jgi:hypothetical protein